MSPTFRAAKLKGFTVSWLVVVDVELDCRLRRLDGVLGHATCLGLSDAVFSRLRSVRWQCALCKKCSFCGELRSEVRIYRLAQKNWAIGAERRQSKKMPPFNYL